jgi:hypothetical protein
MRRPAPCRPWRFRRVTIGSAYRAGCGQRTAVGSAYCAGWHTGHTNADFLAFRPRWPAIWADCHASAKRHRSSNRNTSASPSGRL